MRSIVATLGISFAVVLYLAFSAPLAYANPDFGSCAACHADIANSGPDHGTHAGLANNDCGFCHGQGGFNNPPLSNCTGCHGRDQDAGADGSNPGLGRGLRLHHEIVGAATCGGCHVDVTSPTGVGEDVLPSFYPFALNGAGLNSCDGSEERFQSNSVSLDNDGDGLTDAADPDCAATNTPPIADAGPDQTVNTADTVTLDGSGSNDADGDTLTYAWSLTTPAGSSATLSGATTVTPTFIADVDGTYTATLVVNDGTDDSAPDTVFITAQTVVVNNPPVANAGPDQTVDFGMTVTLDGSGSTDADGDPLTFNWALTSVPASSTATLSNPNAVAPTFVPDVEGTYTATLIVNDGTDDSSPDSVAITVQIVATNTPPVANAGTDRTVTVGDTVPLDGSGSSDADGDPLTFNWTLTSAPAGSAATLSDPNAANPSFVADLQGSYVAQLIVNDGTDSSTPDTVMITAEVVVVNTAPTANAGIDQIVSVGDIVTLDGSGSTDAEGDPLTFNWSLLSAPAGSGAVLTDATAVMSTFVADVAGNYSAQLIVNDGEFDSAPDAVMVTAQIVVVNTPPVADAGLDQSLLVGDTAVVDGSGSSDADGDPLTFSWSLSVPAGSTSTLSDPGAVNPSFLLDVAGDYVAQLVVNDGIEDSAPDSVVVVAAPPVVNQPPVANAGPDQSVLVADTVTLDGSTSSDPNGDPLTYNWSFTSVPIGSTATLSDPTAVQPTFTADVAGDYVVQLIVNDGQFDSAPDTVVISAGAAPTGGELLYNQNCVFCHGDPIVGPAVNPTLPGRIRVTGARVCSIEASIVGNAAGDPDEVRYPNGVPQMAFLKGMGFSDMQQIADYLNTGPVSGERRYVTNCAGCHGDDGSGGYVREDVRGEGHETWEAIVDEEAMQYLGCLSASDVDQIAAYLDHPVANNSPIADAGGPYSGSIGSPLAFDGSGSSDADGSIVAYEWDFGDGGTGSGATATHVYSAAGTFTVTLTVIDDDGASDSISTTVTVSAANSAPSADAGGPYSGTVGIPIQFDGSGTSDAEDPNSALLFQWSFGDGGSATSESPSHTYSAAGTYTVVLTVTDTRGLSDTMSATATIADQTLAPIADPNGPYHGFVNESLTFDGSASSDPDGGSIQSWYWDFGDGGTGAGEMPTHIYTASGSYTVKLTVTDDEGQTSATAMTTADIDERVVNQAPAADAGGPYAAIEGEPVLFDGTGSSDAEDPNSVLTFRWDFGDNSLGFGATPSHRYSSPGTYNVVLTVTDSGGLSDSATTIAVIDAAVVDPDGEALYNSWCLGCHGEFDQPSQGTTIKVLGARSCSIDASIDGNPRAGAETPYPNGVPDMQFMQGTLSTADVDAISGWMNRSAASGLERYTTACASCHGRDGSGGFIAGDIRDDSGDIHEAIADEDAMEFLACLPDEDVDQIGAYLRSLNTDDSDSDDGGGNDKGSGSSGPVFLALLGLAGLLVRRRAIYGR